MRRHATALAAVAGVLAAAPSARAVEQDIRLGRYEARAIVTGTDLRDRARGTALCLADVLVKVSGDPRLAADPRVAALAADAGRFATGLDYWDRMSGISHHDEQGSSDRPYNLTVRFDPAKIDAALRGLGAPPWPDPRPALELRADVTNAAGARFPLTAAEPRGASMREALALAGQKYGMAVGVPGDAAAGAVPVTGTLTWDETAGGWAARWQVAGPGGAVGWGVRGVNFDTAFRNAVAGAMQVLSGHGAPDMP